MKSGRLRKRFIHPDDLPLYYQVVEQNTSRPGPEFVADLEHRIIRRDGEVRHILARTRVLKDDSGRIVIIYGANQDITERKQAEEALRKSEQRFRSLVETTSEWIWEVDQNGVYTYASPKVKDILGYEPEEVVGKTPFDFMDRHEAERVGAIFSDSLSSVNHFPDWKTSIPVRMDER